MFGAIGLTSTQELQPRHIYRRVDDIQVKSLNEIYEYLEPDALLTGKNISDFYKRCWSRARPDTFVYQ